MGARAAAAAAAELDQEDAVVDDDASQDDAIRETERNLLAISFQIRTIP